MADIGTSRDQQFEAKFAERLEGWMREWDGVTATRRRFLRLRALRVSAVWGAAGLAPAIRRRVLLRGVPSGGVAS
jgi:hypothetical protein